MRISKLTITGLIAVVAAVGVIVSPGTIFAQSEKASGQIAATETKKADDKKTDTKVTTYTYTAQAGDSYSLFARKAAQDYNTKQKSGLSQAQILYVETNLTQAAGSPHLSLGEKETLKESDVKTLVDKAKKLTAAEKAAWNQYVAGANFDTAAVGVAR